MTVTIKDVADRAGVSKTTVSHVLNKTRFVAEETRKKVELAAEYLNYEPSSVARSLKVKQGTFKSCLFDAKNTIHVERPKVSSPFVLEQSRQIPFDINHVPEMEESRQHSYFEDGDDPDEKLVLPEAIMQHIVALNEIRHTGCIIFEVLPKHMKIHNYFTLLDQQKYMEFKQHLAGILANIDKISGVGVSGFMKLPYKDTKRFSYQSQRPSCFYPKNPKRF